MLTNAELAMLRVRYSDEFEHTDKEGDEMVRYRPRCVCNNKEINEIFDLAIETSNHLDVVAKTVMRTLRDRVGVSAKTPVSLTRVKCAICPEFLGYFKDGLSLSECSISGICQKCQDQLFKN